MLYDVHYIDITPNLLSLEEPVFMLERELMHGDDPKGNLFNQARIGRRGHYYVPAGPLPLGVEGASSPKFVLTKQSDNVRIPLCHYAQPGAVSLSGAVVVGLKLGIDLVSEAVRQVQTMSDKPVTKAVLVLGHECHSVTYLDGRPGMRCYVGLALVIDT
jgi:hypothetical protein